MNNKKANLGNLICLFMIIVLGVIVFSNMTNFLPKIEVEKQNNLSMEQQQVMVDSLSSLSSVIPVAFVLVTVLVIIGMIVVTIGKGYSGYSEEYDKKNEEVPKEERSHKQTYLEYVMERKKVEELIQ